MPPAPSVRLWEARGEIEKPVPVLNVTEWAEKLLFKTVLGRAVPEKSRSVDAVLDTNGDAEKLPDVNDPLIVVNQLLVVPDAPVHV